MPLSPIPIAHLSKIGLGLKRPEDVVVGRDGRVWASDPDSACAELLPDGGVHRVGKAGGAPNGITMDARGRIVIANFGLESAPTGPLQRLDPDTGNVEVLCAEIDGRTLVASNYPIVDRAGNILCSQLMSWPTNVAWGGDDLRDLNIGSVRRDYVLHARSPVPGLPLSHQR